jgi:hypothetical protein
MVSHTGQYAPEDQLVRPKEQRQQRILPAHFRPLPAWELGRSYCIMSVMVHCQPSAVDSTDEVR